MVNYKQKYLEMKLKYINTKNKLVGAGPSFEEQEYSRKLSNQIKEIENKISNTYDDDLKKTLQKKLDYLNNEQRSLMMSADYGG
tara:strand:- start:83 stop:334 length:252 start_codon:yes stop_codon:yes gene_type:complete